jgi:hypothetical protein
MVRLGSVLLSGLLLSTLPLAADTVLLQDGASYNGHFAGETNNTISFQDNQGAQYQFALRDVQSIYFNPSGDTVVLRNGRSYVGQVTGAMDQSIGWIDQQGIRYHFPTNEVSSLTFSNEAWNGPYQSQGEGLVLPAGSEITVENNLPIDSRAARPGETYRATIVQDVLGSDGRVIIPRNSDATLILRSESGGGIHTADIVLDLYSVTINGVRHYVDTTNLRKSNGTGLGKNRRTAQAVGGMAALGAIIGAIAGGGKGAAIGAAAGAGTGAVGEIVTHGRYVYVPAESRLTFELDKPLVLSPNQSQPY